MRLRSRLRLKTERRAYQTFVRAYGKRKERVLKDGRKKGRRILKKSRSGNAKEIGNERRKLARERRRKEKRKKKEKKREKKNEGGKKNKGRNEGIFFLLSPPLNAPEEKKTSFVTKWEYCFFPS